VKLGIDFGTSTILITKWDEKNPDSDVTPVAGIAAFGVNFIDNVVYIKNRDEIFLGDSAKTFVTSPNAHQENYITGIKRHLLNPDWRCTINLDDEGELTFTVCTMIFKHIRNKIIESHPCDFEDDEAIHTVLSVPFDYSADIRNIISESAERAGLIIDSLIEEPIAASLCYGIFEDSVDAQKVMVVDFGGGTLDTTAIQFTKESDGRTRIETLATGGDSKLGGIDITNILKDYYSSRLKTPPDEKTKFEIFKLCNDYKEIISSFHDDSDSIAIMIEGVNFEYVEDNLTLVDFRKLLEKNGIFKKMKKTFDDCVARSGLNKNEFDKIVLAGGTCKISCIQEYIENYFGKKPVITGAVDIFELVGIGAGLYCKSLSLGNRFNYYVVQKVIYSLGVFSGCNGTQHFNPFVRSNTNYDEYVERRYTLSVEHGLQRLYVYQAPSDDASVGDCKKIGYITVDCSLYPYGNFILALKIQNHDIYYQTRDHLNEVKSQGSVFQM
jgi:molecular chaperone DnaK